MKILFTFALSLLMTLSSLFAAQFKVDVTHSHIGFKVRHMMVSNTKGEFQNFEGSYNYDADNKKLLFFKGTVEINSINTRDDKRDTHLKKPDFFDIEKYPTMRLKMVKHEGEKITFDLTIKKTTKRITFKIEDLSNEHKDPWGYIRTGFVITGKINRRDYGLNFQKVLDTGGIMVGNDVKITIEIEGIKI